MQTTKIARPGTNPASAVSNSRLIPQKIDKQKTDKIDPKQYMNQLRDELPADAFKQVSIFFIEYKAVLKSSLCVFTSASCVNSSQCTERSASSAHIVTLFWLIIIWRELQQINCHLTLLACPHKVNESKYLYSFNWDQNYWASSLQCLALFIDQHCSKSLQDQIHGEREALRGCSWGSMPTKSSTSFEGLFSVCAKARSGELCQGSQVNLMFVIASPRAYCVLPAETVYLVKPLSYLSSWITHTFILAHKLRLHVTWRYCYLDASRKSL